MKKRSRIGYTLLGAAVLIPSPSASALDRIERTFLDYALNMTEEINFEMNRQLNGKPRLNTGFYGTYDSAEQIPQTSYFNSPTFFAEINATDLESERTPGFEGELYSPIFGLSFQTVYNINVGLLYSAQFLDFDSLNDEVHGTGDSHNFGIYLSKQLDCGFKIGGSYLYGWSDVDGANPVGGVGNLTYNMNGASAMAGFSRKYGTNQPGRNIGIDMTGNVLYSSRSFDHKYNLSPENEFTFDGWWFSWQTEVSHNFSDRLAAYGSFALNHLFDETDRSTVPAFFAGTIPGHDKTVGVAGGGVRAVILDGLAGHIGARVNVMDSNYKNFTFLAGLSYKF